MNVLAAILDGAERGSTRYRWLQFQSELAEAGVTVDNVVVHSDGRHLTNARAVAELLAKAPRYDALFVQKLLPPAPLTHLLARRARRLVYDIDDALYAKPEWAGPLDPMLAAADTVIAGSQPIAEYADGHGSAAVHTVPTAIPRPKYDALRSPNDGDGPVRLGWLGYPENLEYLRPIEGVIRDVLAEYDAELRLATRPDAPAAPDPLPLAENAAVEYREWTPATAMADYAACDIALRPMRDDEWTRGKAFTSVVEAMALGLACVVTPVAALAEWVVDGEHGYHAEAPGEWRTALSRLAADGPERERVGLAARERVGELGLWKQQAFGDVLGALRDDAE